MSRGLTPLHKRIIDQLEEKDGMMSVGGLCAAVNMTRRELLAFLVRIPWIEVTKDGIVQFTKDREEDGE